MNNKKPKLYGYKDAYEKLGISQQYLKWLMNNDKISFQRISSGPVFFEEDLIAFEKQRKEKGGSKNKK